MGDWAPSKPTGRAKVPGHCNRCGGPKASNVKCKPCGAAYDKTRNDIKRDRLKKRLSANPELRVKHRQWTAKWRNENIEYAREYGKQYRRQERKLFPEKCKTIAHKARAKRRAARGSYTATEWIKIAQRQRGRCAHCSMKCELERDHIVPLSRGGSNFAFNLQGLCRSCNASKRASMKAGLQHSLFDRLEAA